MDGKKITSISKSHDKVKESLKKSLDQHKKLYVEEGDDSTLLIISLDDEGYPNLSVNVKEGAELKLAGTLELVKRDLLEFINMDNVEYQ